MMGVQKKPYDFLLSLLECHSPSGHEAAATRVWLDYVTPFADEVMTDAYGNAFAVRSEEHTSGLRHALRG